MGERRELNPRMVDSQSTALIHLATSAPLVHYFIYKIDKAERFYFNISTSHHYLFRILRNINKKCQIQYKKN